MKLMITRDQKAQTGLLGGHKGMAFVLKCRIELTPEEQELVTKYKCETHPITYTKNADGHDVPKDTVASLLRGSIESMANVGVLLHNEGAVKDGCAKFKILLDVMETFGGEEVVEF